MAMRGERGGGGDGEVSGGKARALSIMDYGDIKGRLVIL